LSRADPAHLDLALGRRALWGLAINAVIATLAYAARSIDIPAPSPRPDRHRDRGRPRPARVHLDDRFLRPREHDDEGGLSHQGRAGDRPGEGRARGWRNAWANGGVPAVIAAFGALVPPPCAPVRRRLRGGGRHRHRRHLLVGGGQGVWPADVPDHDRARGPAGDGGRDQPRGTLAAVGGAAAVGFMGASLGLYSVAGALLVTVAGVAGSLVESVVGTIAEKRGWMNNDLLNAFNTAVGAGLVIALLRIL